MRGEWQQQSCDLAVKKSDGDEDEDDDEEKCRKCEMRKRQKKAFENDEIGSTPQKMDDPSGEDAELDEQAVAEAFCLVERFLRSRDGFSDLARALRNRLETNRVLPERRDFRGESHAPSYQQFAQALGDQLDEVTLESAVVRLKQLADHSRPTTIRGLPTRVFYSAPNAITRKATPKAGDSLLLPSSSQQQRPVPFLRLLRARHWGQARPGPAGVQNRRILGTLAVGTLEPVTRILGHLAAVFCVAFDRTGRYVITGADDNLVKVWDAERATLRFSLRGHSAEISDISVSHCNQCLATGSVDKTVRVWCLQTGKQLAVHQQHTATVAAVTFLAYARGTQRFLVSTGLDSLIVFYPWNVETKEFGPAWWSRERVTNGARFVSMAASPGGSLVAAGDSHAFLRVFRLQQDGQVARIHEDPAHGDRVDSLVWSHRQALAFATGSRDGVAKVWRFRAGAWRDIPLVVKEPLNMAASSHGGSGGAPFSMRQNDSSSLLTTAGVGASRSANKYKVTMLCWTTDDARIVSVGSDRAVRLWCAQKGTHLSVLTGHTDDVFVLTAHPLLPRLVFSAGHDGKLIAWDMTSKGAEMRRWTIATASETGGENCTMSLFDMALEPRNGAAVAIVGSTGHLCLMSLTYSQAAKQVPRQQFHHTDYMPLLADASGWSLDEHTGLAPHLMPAARLVDQHGAPMSDSLQRLVPGRDLLINPDLADQTCPWLQRPLVAPLTKAESQDVQATAEERTRLEEATFEAEAHATLQGNLMSPSQLHQQQIQYRKAQQAAAKRKAAAERRAALSQQQSQSMEGGSSNTTTTTTTRRRGARGEQQQQNVVPEDASPASVATSFATGSTRSSSSSPTPSASSDSSDTDYEQEGRRRGGGQADTTADAENYARRRRRGLARRTRRASQLDDEEEEGEEEEDDDDNDQAGGGEEEQPAPSSSRPRAPKKKPNAGGSGVPRFPNWMRAAEPRRFPYVPQIGDRVVYCRHGHAIFLEELRRRRLCKVSERMLPPAWTDAEEPCRVVDVRYSRQDSSLLVQSVLTLHPERAAAAAREFVVRSADLEAVPDFLILREHFDAALACRLDQGDRIEAVLDERWWIGTVDRVQPPDDAPRASWSSLVVRWESGDDDRVSPWDCQPARVDRRTDTAVMPDELLELARTTPLVEDWPSAVAGDPEAAELHGRLSEDRLTTFLDRLERAIHELSQLETVAPFVVPVSLDEFPLYAAVVTYPSDLETVGQRLRNRYYRRQHAFEQDVRHIALAAAAFNEPDSTIVRNARVLVEALIQFAREPSERDVVALYDRLHSVDNAALAEYRKRGRDVVADLVPAVEAIHSAPKSQQQEQQPVASSSSSSSAAAAATTATRASSSGRRNRAAAAAPKASWIAEAATSLRAMMTVQPHAAVFIRRLCEHDEMDDVWATTPDLDAILERLTGGGGNADESSTSPPYYSTPSACYEDVERLLSEAKHRVDDSRRHPVYKAALAMKTELDRRLGPIVEQFKRFQAAVAAEFGAHTLNGRATRTSSSSLEKRELRRRPTHHHHHRTRRNADYLNAECDEEGASAPTTDFHESAAMMMTPGPSGAAAAAASSSHRRQPLPSGYYRQLAAGRISSQSPTPPPPPPVHQQPTSLSQSSSQGRRESARRRGETQQQNVDSSSQGALSRRDYERMEELGELVEEMEQQLEERKAARRRSATRSRVQVQQQHFDEDDDEEEEEEEEGEEDDDYEEVEDRRSSRGRASLRRRKTDEEEDEDGGARRSSAARSRKRKAVEEEEEEEEEEEDDGNEGQNGPEENDDDYASGRSRKQQNRTYELRRSQRTTRRTTAKQPRSVYVESDDDEEEDEEASQSTPQLSVSQRGRVRRSRVPCP